jgi:hypothetical protein
LLESLATVHNITRTVRAIVRSLNAQTKAMAMPSPSTEGCDSKERQCDYDHGYHPNRHAAEAKPHVN